MGHLLAHFTLAVCAWHHLSAARDCFAGDYSPSPKGKRFAQNAVKRGSRSTRRTIGDIVGAAS
jgi:hypothetical protein